MAGEVRRHRELYYYEAPEISDADFDTLLRELTALETEHPEAVDGTSPTEEVAPSPAH
ncbi:MAG: hypothetical protein L0K33_08775, partial [Corynebacterium sp.]|nr:hypothetical protein [Corynebacterium sp.]